MDKQNRLPTQDAIDSLDYTRFEFSNSGLAAASEGDFEKARQLALKMLESAIRLHDAPLVVHTDITQDRYHSVW